MAKQTVLIFVITDTYTARSVDRLVSWLLTIVLSVAAHRPVSRSSWSVPENLPTQQPFGVSQIRHYRLAPHNRRALISIFIQAHSSRVSVEFYDGYRRNLSSNVPASNLSLRYVCRH